MKAANGAAAPRRRTLEDNPRHGIAFLDCVRARTMGRVSSRQRRGRSRHDSCAAPRRFGPACREKAGTYLWRTRYTCPGSRSSCSNSPPRLSGTAHRRGVQRLVRAAPARRPSLLPARAPGACGIAERTPAAFWRRRRGGLPLGLSGTISASASSGPLTSSDAPLLAASTETDSGATW